MILILKNNVWSGFSVFISTMGHFQLQLVHVSQVWFIMYPFLHLQMKADDETPSYFAVIHGIHNALHWPRHSDSITLQPVQAVEC
jgi:hypothetical protein